VPLLVTQARNIFGFQVLDPGIISGSSVKVRVVMSPSPVSSAPAWDGTVPVGSLALDTVVPVQLTEATNLSNPAPGYIGAGSGSGSPRISKEVLEKPGDIEGQNQDGTTGFRRLGMPDLKQGTTSSCVQDSFTNSIAWLARKCGFTDKFKDYNVNTEQGLNDLSADLINTYSKRGSYDPESGTRADDTVAGKEQFVADKGLPIQTTVIYSFAEIKDAMRAGCDVEIVFEDTFVSSDWEHMVTVVGFDDSPPDISDKILQHLVFHDSTGGKVGDFHLSLQGLNAGPFASGGKTRIASIAFAVKECCIPPPPPGTQPPPGPKPVLSVSATAFTIAHIKGVTQCPTPIGFFNIVNSGDIGSTLSYSISGIPPWLTAAPTGGVVTAGGLPGIVQLQFNCDVPGPGTYTATLPVAATDNNGTVIGSQNVSVTVVVSQ
jgi:hypothetical protein